MKTPCVDELALPAARAGQLDYDLFERRRERRPARDLLAPIYPRFTEGFATADLQAAKALLSILG